MPHKPTLNIGLIFLLIVLIVAGGIFSTAIHPANPPGTQKLAILTVGGGTVDMGIASSDALVRYTDGSTQNVTGNSFQLFPYLGAAVKLSTTKPVNDSIFQAKIYHIPNFNLQGYCIKVFFNLFKTCPSTALMIVKTAVYITVNSRIVVQSRSNGMYTAYMLTNSPFVSALRDQFANTNSKPCWPTACPWANLTLFGPGPGQTYSRPFYYDLDLTPYRPQAGNNIVKMEGNQTFAIYPVWDCSSNIIKVLLASNCLLGFNPYIVDQKDPIADPTDPRNIITYNGPELQLFPVTYKTPDFSLNVDPTKLSLSNSSANNGNVGYVLVAGLAQNGISGTFHVNQPSGLPANVNFAYDTANDPPVPSTGTPIETVRLRFTALQNVKAGDYTVSISAKISNVTHSVTLPLTITTSILQCYQGYTQCGGISTTIQASSPGAVTVGYPFFITGSVTTRAGVGIGGVTVYLQASWGASASSQTGKDGSFRILVTAPSTPATYRVDVNFPGTVDYSPSSTSLSVLVQQGIPFWVLVAIIIAVILIVVVVAFLVAGRRKQTGTLR